MNLHKIIPLLLLVSTLATVTVAAPVLERQSASQILSSTGVAGGLIVHVGCGDGRLTAALRAGDNRRAGPGRVCAEGYWAASHVRGRDEFRLRLQANVVLPAPFWPADPLNRPQRPRMLPLATAEEGAEKVALGRAEAAPAPPRKLFWLDLSRCARSNGTRSRTADFPRTTGGAVLSAPSHMRSYRLASDANEQPRFGRGLYPHSIV